MPSDRYEAVSWTTPCPLAGNCQGASLTLSRTGVLGRDGRRFGEDEAVEAGDKSGDEDESDEAAAAAVMVDSAGSGVGCQV